MKRSLYPPNQMRGLKTSDFNFQVSFINIFFFSFFIFISLYISLFFSLRLFLNRTPKWLKCWNVPFRSKPEWPLWRSWQLWCSPIVDHTTNQLIVHPPFLFGLGIWNLVVWFADFVYQWALVSLDLDVSIGNVSFDLVSEYVWIPCKLWNSHAFQNCDLRWLAKFLNFWPKSDKLQVLSSCGRR